MESSAITTITKMLESLPENAPIELHTAVGGNSVEDIRRERERCGL